METAFLKPFLCACQCYDIVDMIDNREGKGLETQSTHLLYYTQFICNVAFARAFGMSHLEVLKWVQFSWFWVKKTSEKQGRN